MKSKKKFVSKWVYFTYDCRRLIFQSSWKMSWTWSIMTSQLHHQSSHVRWVCPKVRLVDNGFASLKYINIWSHQWYQFYTYPYDITTESGPNSFRLLCFYIVIVVVVKDLFQVLYFYYLLLHDRYLCNFVVFSVACILMKPFIT